jgi:outer membrane protein assembly factor BamB
MLKIEKMQWLKRIGCFPIFLMVYLPVNSTLELLVSQAKEKLKEGEIESAVQIYQKVINEYSNSVIKLDDNLYIGARQFCHNEIKEGGIGVLKVYRACYDPIVEEKYNNALKSNDEKSYKEILDVYFNSSYADKAKYALGNIYFSKGSFNEALAWYDKVEDRFPVLFLKMAICYEKLGNFQEEIKILIILNENYGKESIILGGKEIRVKEIVEEKIKCIKKSFEKTSYCPLALKWDISLTNDNRRELSSPVIVNNKLYLATSNRIYSIDNDNGRIIWSKEITPYLNKENLGYLLSGITLLGSQNLLICKFPLNPSDLYAFDLIDGKEIWKLQESRGIYFNPPDSFNNVLFNGIILKQGLMDSFYIASIDKFTTDTIWQTYLGSGYLKDYRFSDGTFIIHDEENLYIETGFFSLCAVDKDLGSIKWIFQYMPDNEDIYENGFPYRNIIMDSKNIYFSPVHSQRIFAIHKYSGRILWELKKGTNEYIAGIYNDFFYTVDEKNIYQIDKNGKRSILFQIPVNEKVSKVTLYENLLFFTIDKSLIILDASTGKEKERSYIGKDADCLFVQNGNIYFYSGSNFYSYTNKEDLIKKTNSNLDKNPLDIDANIVMSNILRSEGKIEESINLCEGILEKVTSEKDKEKIIEQILKVSYEYVNSLYSNKNYYSAINYCEKALSFNRSFKEMQFLWILLNCYEKTGNIEKLEKLYTRLYNDFKGKLLNTEENIFIDASYLAEVKLKKIPEIFYEGCPEISLLPPLKQIWKAKFVINNGYLPVIVNDKIFIISNNRITILNINDGKFLVKDKEIPNKTLLLAYYINNYGPPPRSFTCDENRIFIFSLDSIITCFDIRTFSVLWKYKLETTKTLSSCSIFSGSNLLYVYIPDEGIIAIAKEDGKVKWKIKGNFTMPYIEKDFICVVSKDNMKIIFMNGLLCEKKWEYNLDINKEDVNLTIYDKVIYGLSHSGTLFAVDLKEGNLLYKKSNSNWSDSISLSVSSVGIFFSTNNYFIYGIDRLNGNLLWSSKLELKGSIPVLIALGEFVYAFFNNKLNILDAKSGKVFWSEGVYMEDNEKGIRGNLKLPIFLFDKDMLFIVKSYGVSAWKCSK